MGLFSKSAGYADVNDDVEYVRQYFSEGEDPGAGSRHPCSAAWAAPHNQRI